MPGEDSMVSKSKGPGDLIRKNLHAARRTLGAGVAPVLSRAGRVVESVVSRATGSQRPTAATVPPPDPPATGPIADYDSLTVAQVKPRLAGLSAADLRRVRDHETAGKNRKTVLAEIDRLLKA
jgi:hypothetical protein